MKKLFSAMSYFFSAFLCMTVNATVLYQADFEQMTDVHFACVEKTIDHRIIYDLKQAEKLGMVVVHRSERSHFLEYNRSGVFSHIIELSVDKTDPGSGGLCMFSKKLSSSVLSICDSGDLSYEAAAELCDLSSRYFGDIARGKTAPTILTLEKLCVGFDLTPNDFLIPSDIWREMSFRKPMSVAQIRCFHSICGLTGFPVCPQCGRTLEREYQPYCDRCGQCLDWKDFSKATIILPQK